MLDLAVDNLLVRDKWPLLIDKTSIAATGFVLVKTLLAPCLNWEAVLRSMFLLVRMFHCTPIWLKSQVGLKVLHELRSPALDLRE